MGIADRRIYYNNSECLTFEGVVEEQVERGGRWHVRLSRTGFYPTSGGQPFDVGSIDGAKVLDVYVDEDEVFHALDKPLQVGQVVQGHVDRARRFDHMQHHTGQHILSACFEQLMNVDTVGFHLGDEVVTIDLAIAQISDEDLCRVETFANEIVWRDLAVTASFMPDGDLSGYQLRHPPKVSRDIRIVSIDGFDANACGGTHVARTGQVGQIIVLKSERMRGGTRLTFLCGDRALKDHRRRVQLLTQVCSKLSASMDDLVDTVDKLQQNLSVARKAEANLRDELWRARAAQYAKAAETVSGGVRSVCMSVPDVSGVSDLKRLGTHIAAEMAAVAHAVVVVGQVGDRIHIQAIASPDSIIGANDWVAAVLNPLGGKGGGNTTSAQGSVSRSDTLAADDVVRTAKAWLSKAVKLRS